MRMRRAIRFAVPVSLVGAFALALTPIAAAVDGPFPDAGKYKTQGGSTTISDDGDWKLSWKTSRVFRWEGNIPTRWQVNVTYFNRSDEPLTLTCSVWDTDQVRETIYRDGNSIGYVSAERDMCSKNPDWTWDVGPNQSYTGWAVFHNVPWLNDRVSLQWQNWGTSEELDPFGH